MRQLGPYSNSRAGIEDLVEMPLPRSIASCDRSYWTILVRRPSS
jgi:hypothetical protein